MEQMGSHKCYCKYCLNIPIVYIESVGYFCKNCIERIIGYHTSNMSIIEIVEAYKNAKEI